MCRFSPALALLVLAGCVRYQPRPLDPPRLEQEFKARSLNDAGLRKFAGKPEWPPPRLDRESLTVAGLYYSPELQLARARVQEAEAAIETARPRPNPSLSVGGGWTNSPESAVIFHFDPTLTLETAGKRALRILAAEQQARVARLELAEAGWRVRSRVRTAWIEYLLALRSLQLVRGEREIRTESVEIMEKRLSVGDVSRPDVDLARGDLIAVEVARKSAEAQVAANLAALASAVGLPVAALQAFDFAPPAEPAPLASLPLPQLQKAGLLHRVDVQRSLAEYAAAETALRLEIARQYPDIQLTPGYSFDEGHHKIDVGKGFPIPVFNRNRGPIAEAGARREQAAARFNAVQAQAIGEMEKGLAGYGSSLAELAEARRQIGLAGERERYALRALAAGEEDRLTVTGTRLQGSVAARAAWEAMHKTYLALGALEDAVQQPLEAIR